MKHNLPDSLDKAIAGQLARDGRKSIREISKDLNVAVPTVRSRIKKMVEAGVLRTAALINPEKTELVTLALVGITVIRQEELELKLEEVARLDEVNWAAVVTGRYDIIAEVVCPGGMSDLYRFLSKDLPQLGGVRDTESFVLMKTAGKWVFPPGAKAGPDPGADFSMPPDDDL